MSGSRLGTENTKIARQMLMALSQLKVTDRQSEKHTSDYGDLICTIMKTKLNHSARIFHRGVTRSHVHFRKMTRAAVDRWIEQ